MRVVQKALTFDDVSIAPGPFHRPAPRRQPEDPADPHDSSSTSRWCPPPWTPSPKRAWPSRWRRRAGSGSSTRTWRRSAQAAEVSKVKRYESGVVKDPITIAPSMSVREVLNLIRTHKISGLPVVEGKRVVGHRHQPRPALRDQSRPAGAQHHDAARAAGHGEGRGNARGSPGADAQAPARARAGGQSPSSSCAARSR